jgi:uncharacterized protein (DUF952 family)
MASEPIFHIADPASWADAGTRGTYEWSTRGATLAEVGYLHCSYRHQVQAVADAVYADWGGDLVLLEIDPDRVAAEIRVEAVDGATQQFPHIYGPLPVEAVVAFHPMARGGAGWAPPASA